MLSLLKPGLKLPNKFTLKKLKVKATKERFVSSIVLYEIYQLTLKKEGRETAKLRTTIVEQDFKVIDVDAEIAKNSAEVHSKYNMSTAGSIVAATALLLNATCISDDPHFKAVKEIKTDWI